MSASLRPLALLATLVLLPACGDDTPQFSVPLTREDFAWMASAVQADDCPQPGAKKFREPGPGDEKDGWIVTTRPLPMLPEFRRPTLLRECGATVKESWSSIHAFHVIGLSTLCARLHAAEDAICLVEPNGSGGPALAAPAPVR